MKKYRMLQMIGMLVMMAVVLAGCNNGAEETSADVSEQESIVEVEESESIEEEISEGVNEMVEEDALDTSDLYVGDRYCVGQVNVYAEPSESAKIVGTLADQTIVQVMGMHHISQFYKASVDGEEVGYIRTVDLTEFGEYNEETDLVDEIPADETDSQTSTGGGNGGSDFTTDTNLGMSEDDFMDYLDQNGFGGTYYDGDSASDDGGYQFGQSGSDGLSTNVTIQ